MITVLRRLTTTVGLVVLWAKLYPFLWAMAVALPQNDSRAFGWISPEFLQSSFCRIPVLIYLTFWFGCYVDGFFNEWTVLSLRSLEVLLCGCRWLMQSIIRLLLPFVISLGQYWGLVHFTTVPSWLQCMAAFVFWVILTLDGWHYPRKQLIHAYTWQRFQ